MTHHLIRCFAVTALIVLSPLPSPMLAQETPGNLGDALTKGDFSLDLRYRFETVDQDGFDNQGKASTLRTAFGYRTRWWKGLQVFAQFEDVHDIGYGDAHDNLGSGDLWNGVPDYPVIADPEITEINQAYLGIRPLHDLVFRVGLQEIVIDNARFVGNVGWRQNHQSYEALNASLGGADTLTIGYTYFGRVHTITGASLPMASHHADVGYGFSIGTLKGYVLRLDYDDEPQWGLSTATYGAFFDGKTPLTDSTTLTYRLEYAQQKDTGNNPNSVDVGYRLADLGLDFGKITVTACYEVLEGTPGEGAFRTPLATLHKFNGWADKFLVTPERGLEDLYFSVKATLGSFNMIAVYHDFSANSGSAAWGSEIDAQILYTTPWKQKLALKAAFYSADEWATDTDKIWLWTSWGF